MAAPKYTPVGSKYGRLTVIGPSFMQRREWYSPCRCDCGCEKSALRKNLANGHTRSCGCLAASLSHRRHVTHGMSGTPTWKSYRNMLSRCHNPKVARYPEYGGRGIKVCERWLGDAGFENFLADMGKRPIGTTLDRKDSNGDYEPGNCRWATDGQQRLNKRSNAFIEWNGNRKTITEWAAETGIDRRTIARRLQLGWDVHRLLTEPAIRGRNQFD